MKIFKKISKITALLSLILSMLLPVIPSYAYNKEWNHDFSNKDGYPVHFTVYYMCKANGDCEERGIEELEGSTGSAVEYFDEEKGFFDACEYHNRVINGKLIDTVTYNNVAMDIWQYTFAGDYENYIIPTYTETTPSGALYDREGQIKNRCIAYFYTDAPIEYKDYSVWGFGDDGTAHDVPTIYATEGNSVVRLYIIDAHTEEMAKIAGTSYEGEQEDYAILVEKYSALTDFFKEWAMNNEKQKNAMASNPESQVIETVPETVVEEPVSESEPIIVTESNPNSDDLDNDGVIDNPKSNKAVLIIIPAIILAAVIGFLALKKKK